MDDSDHILSACEDVRLFAPVFRRHYPAIHRFAARRLGADVADDIAASVFERAVRQIKTYDATRADAAPWLYGIATNLIREHARSEIRRLKIDAALVQTVQNADPSTESDGRVATALLDLSSEEREAVLLLAWADLTYAQIADALGVPIGTVRSRIHRARTRLKSALNEHAHTPEGLA